MRWVLVGSLSFVLLLDCGDKYDPLADAEPLFPADVISTFSEVRDCRRSIDHDLRYIRVLADSVASGPYATRAEPFPEGATVVKVEYADDSCTDLEGFTAMQKRGEGSDRDAGDWLWQRTDPNRKILEHGAPSRCVSCHSPCQSPDGYEWTCAEP